MTVMAVKRVAGWTPKVGTFWVWRLEDPAARCLLEVTGVQWDGELWSVQTRILTAAGTDRPGDTASCTRDLFRHACRQVGVADAWILRWGTLGLPRTWNEPEPEESDLT